MALLVQLVIGQLELVEVDDGVHPVCASIGGVGMDVEPGGGALLLKAPHPGRVLVLVAVLVHRRHVHQQDVGGVWVQIVQLHFQWWEHPPIKKQKFFLYEREIHNRFLIKSSKVITLAVVGIFLIFFLKDVNFVVF